MLRGIGMVASAPKRTLAYAIGTGYALGLRIGVIEATAGAWLPMGPELALNHSTVPDTLGAALAGPCSPVVGVVYGSTGSPGAVGHGQQLYRLHP